MASGDNGGSSHRGGRRRAYALLLVAAVTLPSAVRAAVFFDRPVEFGEANGLIDWNVQVASDRAGNWLAAWGLGGAFTDPADIVSVQSTDAGASWSAPVSAGFPVSYVPLGLGATGAGRFVVAWSDFNGYDGSAGTFVAVTTNGGTTWSAPRSVPVPPETYGFIWFQVPVRQLYAETDGTLLFSYVTINTGPFDYGTGPCRYYVIRSTDEGVSWSTPVNLGAPTTGYSDTCAALQLASDGGGKWMAVWPTEDSLGSTIGTDLDIVFSRSIDDGVSWSPPAAVDPGAGLDGAEQDYAPTVASDRAGRWIVAWQSSNTLGGTLAPGDEGHVLFSRSDDAGTSWTSPAAMNPRAATQDEPHGDFRVSRLVTAGGDGVWLFAAAGLLFPQEGVSVVARSVDGGLTWTVPNRLNGWMRSEFNVYRSLTGLATDGAGHWVAGLGTTGSVDSSIGLSAGSPLCPEPLAGCKSTVLPGKSKLLMSERKPLRPVLKWKWTGQATSLADFGDPTSSATYRACLYDAGGRALFGGVIPPGGTCGTEPCWEANAAGFFYQTGLSDTRYGLVKLMLRAGNDGAAKLILGGKGPQLANPRLGGFDLPLRMQLDSSDTGTCWEGTFGTATLNGATLFKAQSD